MGILQRIYDKIRNIKTPPWYKALMAELQEVIVTTLLQIGKDLLVQIEAQMRKVATQNLSNKNKLDVMVRYCKDVLKISLKDAPLNLLLEIIYNRLKIKGEV